MNVAPGTSRSADHAYMQELAGLREPGLKGRKRRGSALLAGWRAVLKDSHNTPPPGTTKPPSAPCVDQAVVSARGGACLGGL